MLRVHSHYENLKVPRNASPDAIRAAYRALTRQHHPDRNPGNADAQRVMAIVNVAYAVLSDPARRREHDAWIVTSEAEPRVEPRPVVRRTRTHREAWSPPPEVDDPDGRMSGPPHARGVPTRVLRRLVATGVLVVAVAWMGFEAADRFDANGRKPVAFRVPGAASPRAAVVPGPDPSAPPWTGSPLAPNGHAWPAGSGYVEAYPRLNETGQSELMADNRANRAPMFVKLVSLDGPQPLPVRTFRVGGGAVFRLGKLTSGTYDLRYRNLESGLLTRSSPFILEEVATPTGMQPSSVEIRLGAPGQGNPRAFALTEIDF